MKKLYFFAIALFLMLSGYSQVYVNSQNNSPQELVEAIFNGDDVVISNVVFDGDSLQFAYFQNNNSILPVDSGLVMATGDASYIVGDDYSYITGIGYDEDLAMLASGITMMWLS